MHLVEGRLLLSPTDLVGFLACAHLTQLELAAGRGEMQRPDLVDPELELLARRGQLHEATQLERLAAERGAAVTIADHSETLDGLSRAEAETLAAMRDGAPLIYQAAFFHGRWRGRADFLLRVEEPSDLGPWSYEVADAKLARSVKVGALLQMCEYSQQVTRLQGRAPEHMHVVLGDGREETHRVCDYDAYFRGARKRFEQAVEGGPQETYPNPVDHCKVCSWRDACDRRRRDDDHLSLVAGMRRDHTRRLATIAITKVAELAAAPEDAEVPLSDASWLRLRRQAALQVHDRETGEHVYELLDCAEPGLGLAALPPPSPGDLFFDMEGDPYVEDGGLEYLFGITEVAEGEPRFRAFWGHDRAHEKVAFEQLIDFIVNRLDHEPSLHVYHYANYEVAALKKLMSRHATREDEVDRLLRGGVFVDLYQVVHQGIRVSRESYSLKSLEVFYMERRDEEIADAVGSIVAYERWRETGDRSELDAIAAYNQRDCESTWRLRDWLEKRRDEWAVRHGDALPRPELHDGAPSEKLLVQSEQTRALVEALVDGVPDEPTEQTEKQSGRWLLAQLLDWHRREDKSTWWAFFDRLTKTDQQLVEDSEAIGDIQHLGEVRLEKKSVVHGYSYDGRQEHKLSAGKQVFDPRTGRSCGEIVAIDDDSGVLELKRGPSFASADHPRSLIPGGPFDSRAMRESLQRLAHWAIDHDVAAPGDYRAARDLLLRLPPRLRDGSLSERELVAPGKDATDAAVRVVGQLDNSFLAIQGPPGAGKTYTGAQIIADQVRRGHRVGICATTHRAIGELLKAVCDAAGDGSGIRMLQKCDDGEECPSPLVERADKPEDVETALTAGDVDVVAGTQWLFSRPAMTGALDLLVIDEAGQMSLANAVAAASSARNLVLLGDPQQLAQPSQGIHPPGAGASALEHVLNGAETIPADRGVFLDTTRRMHPDVCSFISTAFYEGRLAAEPSCAGQRLNSAGDMTGTGLRLAAVAHTGNRTSSPEEVVVTRELVDRLLGATWTDAQGATHPVGIDDILVLAPYNVHVRRLRDGLPSGARVGTVDKFQGQQAAVSIYAMASSSAEDLPRNLEFLFNRNRLNVAVSRARAVSVIVCSPSLLHAGCRTPEQLRLVSALCRYAEMAVAIAVDASRMPAPDLAQLVLTIP
jgi:predicted RecB family nuclease